MSLKKGDIVQFKLTKEDVMVIDVGPAFKEVLALSPLNPNHPTPAKQQYLQDGMYRIRLPNYNVVDVYGFELTGAIRSISN